jgi:hypothetical protein
MRNILKVIASVILCTILVVSSLAAILSFYIRSNLLSQEFYLGVVADPSYMEMVKNAIHLEFESQSSYVGIPVEVFDESLNDSQLHLMLRKHIEYAVNYLDGLAPYTEPVYPVEYVRDPLYAYLEKTSKEQGTEPAADQYSQIDLVAADSAALIQKHICVIDLNLVNSHAAFKSLLGGLNNIKDLYIPAILVGLGAIFLLVLLSGKKWRTGLARIMTAFWISGGILLVPMLALRITGLTGRISLETGYFKFFVDTVLKNMNFYFLLWGLLLFLISSTALILLKVTDHPPVEEKGFRLEEYSDSIERD